MRWFKRMMAALLVGGEELERLKRDSLHLREIVEQDRLKQIRKDKENTRWWEQMHEPAQRVPCFLVRHGGVVSLEGLDQVNALSWPNMELVRWKDFIELWTNCKRESGEVYVLTCGHSTIGVTGCSSVARLFAEEDELHDCIKLPIENRLMIHLQNAGT